MCSDDSIRQQLAGLASVLDEADERDLARLVLAALGESDEGLVAFLKSNELWGGAGSIADQAGIECAREVRQRIEASLVRLGEAQLKMDVVNLRTQGWVSAFKQWAAEGL